jgi:putative ABC transport system permease protein
MFELEKEIRKWTKQLGRGRNLEEADIAELESHVRDEIARSVKEGMDEEAAFRAATEGPDEANVLQAEYGKGRLMSSLVWSYLKIALRKMRKQKAYSFINIVGLGFGLACSILILFWVRDELGYNMFHEKAGQLYRVNKAYQIGAKTEFNPSTPYPLARALRENFPEIADATGFYRNAGLFKFEDKAFFERGVCVVDGSFFRMFTFPFVQGDPSSALAQPGSVVVTETVAAKYFGGRDAVGKTLTLDQTKELLITGVIKDIPSNSDLRYDIFVAAPGFADPDAGENWESHYLSTYALLRRDADIADLEKKMSVMIQGRLPEEKISLKLQPLTKLHLYTVDGREEGMKYVYFFSVIAAFILIIACINYINLSTARSEKRAKEVGLRKVVGAHRSQIARQFFGESVLFTLIALAVAFVLIQLLQGPFNALTGKTLKLADFNPGFVLGLVLITAFTGLASGLYPALVMSSFEPARALREGFRRRGRKASLRKALVVTQFALSIMLLIGTGVIFSQLRYMQKTDLGFDQADMLYLRMNDKVRDNYDAFRTELMRNPEIVGVTRTFELPMEIWAITRGVTWEGKETPGGAAFGFAVVDYDTLDLMKMKFAAGRNFSREFPSDASNFIFNEKAIEVMGMRDPVGKPFKLSEVSKGTIIGVVKNFHSLPLTYAIEPVVIVMDPKFHRLVLVKIRPEGRKAALGRIEAAWKTFAPGFPFEYRFIDERFGLNYAQEVRAGRIFGYFVMIAIFISCLGLLGLASFTAEQKTKEIGVRKALGASTAGVVALLTRQFLRWVVLSNLIAWPVAYLAMRGWLNHFAYRTRVGLLVFVLSAALTLAIALLTVSYQAVKAARANPVDSLRYE